MSDEQALKRLSIVDSEIEMYYQPKPEGHELVEGAKTYSAKDFDVLMAEKFKLKRQLGLN